MSKHVVLALSGGVDSAVAALLLLRKGYNVTPIYMTNWNLVEESGNCHQDDIISAEKTCKYLGLKLHHVNFVTDYWNCVFSELLSDYERGWTPNPDILCNKFIKFDALRRYIHHSFGDQTLVATGHYAQLHTNCRIISLVRGVDPVKDQTFFLSGVNNFALKNVIFPIGHLLKSQVKDIARSCGLDFLLKRKESMGLCFIGAKRKFSEFLLEFIPERRGIFTDVETNDVVGEHRGYFLYTIGQRALIPGKPHPYFVSHIDVSSNTVYLVPGNSNPLLFCNEFKTSEFHWVKGSPPRELVNNGSYRYLFKIQHQRSLALCSVFMNANRIICKLDLPQRAISRGQYLVLYDKNECLGCGQIVSTKQH